MPEYKSLFYRPPQDTSANTNDAADQDSGMINNQIKDTIQPPQNTNPDTTAKDSIKTTENTTPDIKTDSSYRIKPYNEKESENVFDRINKRDEQLKKEAFTRQKWTQQKKDTISTKPQKPAFIINNTSAYFPEKNLIKNINTDIVAIRPTEKKALYNNNDSSLNTKTEHKPIKRIPHSPEKKGQDWMLGIVIALLILFIWVRTFYNRYLSLFMRSVFSYLSSVNLYRNKNILFQRSAFVLNIIFVTSAGLFIYNIFSYHNNHFFNMPPFKLFLFYMATIAGIYIAKYITCHIIGFIFYKHELFSEYLHNVFIINKNIGLYLLPIVIALPYVPETFYKWVMMGGFTIVGILLFMRISRGLQIIINKNVSLFYLILYLCIFEILPFMVVYRVLFI